MYSGKAKLIRSDHTPTGPSNLKCETEGNLVILKYYAGFINMKGIGRWKALRDRVRKLLSLPLVFYLQYDRID